MKSVILSASLAAFQCTGNAWSAPIGEIEGVPVEDSCFVDGAKLVLNGAGMRKRAYFKTDVTSVYLSEPRKTAEGIETAPGAKRIRLTMLRDLPGSAASRYFINDFKAVATDTEFKQLINEIGQLGEIYSRIRQINKGDVFHIDWTPGKGISSSLNGKPMTIDGNPTVYMNNELMYRLMVRMYLFSGGSAEMRENLLGRSHSMLNPLRTP